MLPSPRWFIEAAEALGDAAIASIPATTHPTARVDLLVEFLQSHPNHEKLHQRLEEAARAAARDPKPVRRPAPSLIDDPDDADDLGSENGQDD